MFRPPSLLAPQIVPTAANTPAGQPGLLRPSRTRFVASPRIGYANRPKTGNWRCGDLHPARLRPCRLLLSFDHHSHMANALRVPFEGKDPRYVRLGLPAELEEI